MRRPFRLMAPIALAILAVGALAFFSAYRAARHVPAFYVQALNSTGEEQKAAGQEFERQSFALHNAVRRRGHWSARFTQDEINGWLAAELPEKFSTALPVGISQPRVAIAADRVQIAAHFEQRGMETVLSLAGEIRLTAEPNEIAMRIERVRAGSLPMPLGKLLDEISALAATAGIPLRWTEVAGDPVALLRLPPELDRQPFVLETLELGEGALTIAGSTGGADENGGQIQQAEREPNDSRQR
jgi:hypothetical protein